MCQITCNLFRECNHHMRILTLCDKKQQKLLKKHSGQQRRQQAVRGFFSSLFSSSAPRPVPQPSTRFSYLGAEPPKTATKHCCGTGKTTYKSVIYPTACARCLGHGEVGRPAFRPFTAPSPPAHTTNSRPGPVRPRGREQQKQQKQQQQQPPPPPPPKHRPHTRNGALPSASVGRAPAPALPPISRPAISAAPGRSQGMSSCHQQQQQCRHQTNTARPQLSSLQTHQQRPATSSGAARCPVVRGDSPIDVSAAAIAMPPSYPVGPTGPVYYPPSACPRRKPVAQAHGRTGGVSSIISERSVWELEGRPAGDPRCVSPADHCNYERWMTQQPGWTNRSYGQNAYRGRPVAEKW